MVYKYIFMCKIFSDAEKTQVSGEDAVITTAYSDDRAYESAFHSFKNALKSKGFAASSIEREVVEMTLVSKTAAF